MRPKIKLPDHKDDRFTHNNAIKHVEECILRLQDDHDHPTLQTSILCEYENLNECINDLFTLQALIALMNDTYNHVRFWFGYNKTYTMTSTCDRHIRDLYTLFVTIRWADEGRNYVREQHALHRD